MGRRSAFGGPWHNCPRCGRKTHTSEMTRQRGHLICKRRSCFDKDLPEQRDKRRAQALQKPTRELQPPDIISGPAILNDDLYF